MNGITYFIYQPTNTEGKTSFLSFGDNLDSPFLDGWNILIRELEERLASIFKDTLNPISILLLERSHLADPDHDFFQAYYEEFLGSNTEEGNFTPIITLGTLDVKNIKPEIYSHINYLHVRKFDSSIWNFYCRIINEGETSHGGVDDFFEDVITKIKKIQTYYNEGRYNFAICREFFELSGRILANARLMPFGGHHNGLIPFTFHSESKLKERFLEMVEKLKSRVKETSHPITWKILLVDDYAFRELRSKNSGDRKSTKLDIIEQLINEKFDTETDKISFKIEAVSNVKDALENKNIFDIILLDFLFSDHEKEEGSTEISEHLLLADGMPHYGTSLISSLPNGSETESDDEDHGKQALEKVGGNEKNNKGDKGNDRIQQGPLGQYWILPITVFSHSLIDEMRNQSISFISQDYRMLRGGDPINTPYGFLYSLVKMMNDQMSIIDSISEKSIRKDIQKALEDFEKARELELKRDAFSKKFEDVLKQFNTLKQIEEDRQNGSLFAQSIDRMLSESNKDYNHLLIHFREFLYNLSFRNLENNEELVMEYGYLKEKLSRS